MTRFTTNSNRQDFLNQLELLRQAYQNFDNRKNKTPIQIAALAESEEEFVKDGLIPYLENIIKEATDVLRASVSIKAEAQPGKPVKIDVETKAAAIPSPVAKPQPVPTPKPVPRPVYTTRSASKAPPTGLRVTIGSDRVIHEFYGSDTFTQAIAYAFDKVGIETVINKVKYYGLYLDGEPLVKKGPFTSPMADNHEVIPGYFTNTHSNNPTKKLELERLAEILGIHWSVSILKERR